MLYEQRKICGKYKSRVKGGSFQWFYFYSQIKFNRISIQLFSEKNSLNQYLLIIFFIIFNKKIDDMRSTLLNWGNFAGVSVFMGRGNPFLKKKNWNLKNKSFTDFIFRRFEIDFLWWGFCTAPVNSQLFWVAPNLSSFNW